MSGYTSGFIGGMAGAMLMDSMHASSSSNGCGERVDELEADNRHLRVLLGKSCERIFARGRVIFMCVDGKNYVAEVPK